MTEPHTGQQLTPAEIRLAQYGQRTGTWSTATYDSGTERALHEIALGLKAEVDRLRREAQENDRALTQTIDQRDAAQDMADKLAYAIAPIEVIGEHSSGNDPWENAYELVTSEAEVARLRARVAELEAAAERHAQVMQVIERACDKGYDPDRFELAEAAGIPAEQVAS